MASKHAIIIVKNIRGEYLQYYENSWNSYLFLNCKCENNKKRALITLAVPRKFKNVDGIYETDFIRIVLWNVIALNTKEYCKSGDLLGVKGRIQINSYKDSEENTHYSTDIIAEKITFLTSKKANDVQETIEEEE